MKTLFGVDKLLKLHNHPQTCKWCHKSLKKDNEMVSTISGAFHNSLNYNRYHLKCFKEGLKKEGIIS